MTWVGFRSAELETVEIVETRRESQLEAACRVCGAGTSRAHTLLEGRHFCAPTSEVPQLCHPRDTEYSFGISEDKFMFL